VTRPRRPGGETTFDYVIVGAGPAGCLIANRLSTRPDLRVLLLEAGPADSYPWIHIPVGYLYCIGNPRTDWCLKTEPVPGLNGRQIGYPRGRTLGGTSSINGMIYMRGQARDYDGWAALLNDEEWAWENSLPDFMRHEDHHLGGDALHGSGGEWRVERQRLRWDILDAFAEAAQQAGVPATADFNRGDNEGVGTYEVNQKRGTRWNAARAFLRPVCYERPNVSIWTSAHVSRLLIDSTHGAPRCTGLDVWDGQQQVRVAARREVILAAGAVGTPQLMQLSGLGDGDALRALGIDVRADLPGVGENLQDHLQIRCMYRVSGIQTLNTRANRLAGKAMIALEYALRRSGPMSMSPSQLGVVARSRPDMRWPDLQYHVQPLSLDRPGEPLHDFDAFTAVVCKLNPSSRGHVHIRTPDFRDAPGIAPNYLSTEDDRQTLLDSLHLTRRIVQQPALQKFRPEEFKPGPAAGEGAQLERALADMAGTVFHPVGTAKMGLHNDRAAVVDARLKVHGIAGLRVADASVMPTLPSGNTAAPTLMIAEKAARWILAEAA
jgi:choline dehydrogenase